MRTETILRKRYHKATPTQVAGGLTWYAAAREQCQTLADASGLDVETVAHIVAVLSPRIHWTRNLTDAAKVIETGDRPGLRNPVDKARRILAGDFSANSARKTLPFAQAICGDDNAVVLDVWALRAAGCPTDKPSNKEFRRIQEAYRSAAESVGVTPREFQAIVWLQTRESHIRKNGRKEVK